MVDGIGVPEQAVSLRENSSRFKPGTHIPTDWVRQPSSDQLHCTQYSLRNGLRVLGFDPSRFDFTRTGSTVYRDDVVRQQSEFPGLHVVTAEDLNRGNSQNLADNALRRTKSILNTIQDGGVVVAAWPISGRFVETSGGPLPITHAMLLVGAEEGPQDILRSRITYHDPYTDVFQSITLGEIKQNAVKGRVQQFGSEDFAWMNATLDFIFLQKQ